MVLNLVNSEESDIKYTISKFPDGQQSITIKDRFTLTLNQEVEIYSRLNSFLNLELIICANQALRNLGISRIRLYTPYFLGARSDRQFEKGAPHYLKQVICPIINAQNFVRVSILDPHSDILEMGLNNFHKVKNPLHEYALDHISLSENPQADICLVSPDAGAYKKIFDVAAEAGIENIITATKVRDIKTGKIVRTEVPNLNEQPIPTKFVIIDDICDGGRTFIELAKAIKLQIATAEIYLIVTHGIFSAGLYELSKHFTRAYTTNSVQDIDVGPYSDYTVNKDFLIQIPVF